MAELDMAIRICTTGYDSPANPKAGLFLNYYHRSFEVLLVTRWCHIITKITNKLIHR